MQVRIGGTLLASGAVEWTSRKHTDFDADGLPSVEHLRVELKGTILGTSQADITRQCVVLEQSCRRQFQDVVLLADGGGIAASLPNATSLNGVRIVEGPDYPAATGGEYTTYRTFTLAVEAEYPARASGVSNVVAFEERVQTSGGGPTITFLQPTRGLPYKVVTADNTPYFATQQGSAVGLLGYPTPPPPLWPGALLRAPEIERARPTITARGPRNYRISWTYTFGSVAPLR